MAYCTNCGHQLPQDAQFCGQCGKKVVQASCNERENAAHTYEPPAEKKPSMGNAIASMVFAILSVEMSVFCLFPVIFFAFTALSVAFICVARSNRNQYINLSGKDNVFTKVANICSIVAIPVTSVFSFVGCCITMAVFE